MTRQELIDKAMEMLRNDDDIFCEAVNALDSWNGFADGFRCYSMYEIDDLFYGVKISDFLDKLSANFNHTDEYFYDTIYGIASTDSMAEVYRDNTDAGEVFDELLDKWDRVGFYGYNDFMAIMDDLNNENYDDADSNETQDFTWKDEE
jgi:hypothetical protein